MALKVKTNEDRDAEREFINQANRSLLEEIDSIWSIAHLKKLSDDDLVDRLDACEAQGALIRWRILWELRQRYNSDKLFGQFLSELKLTRPNWAWSQSDISRSIAAGKFCEEYKLSDLNKAKINQGSIHLLARMPDKEAAVKILSDIRHKNVPLRDVERMIEQSKAVATIEQKPVVMPYDKAPAPIRTVQVVNSQAIESIEQSVSEPPALNLAVVPIEMAKQVVSVRMDNEVMNPKFIELTDEEMAEEIYLFCKKFPVSFMRLAGVVKLLLTKVTMRGYGK